MSRKMDNARIKMREKKKKHVGQLRRSLELKKKTLPSSSKQKSTTVEKKRIVTNLKAKKKIDRKNRRANKQKKN